MRTTRLSLLLMAVVSVAAVAPIGAADLQAIDRTIGEQPAYRSTNVGYCLLVFGPEASTRVWLVRDGERLYVDRNGDGNLTGPDELVTAESEWSNPERGIFEFEAGDIGDGALTHKHLRVSIFRIDHLAERDEQVKAELAREPATRGCLIRLDVEMPGRKGNGIEGRVGQSTSFRDVNGLFRFGDAPQTAPVVHFGGPLQVTLYGPQDLRVGRETDLILGVGTPGLGPGTTAYVAYDELIPDNVHPQVEIVYQARDSGAAPVRERHELKERC